MIQTHPVPPIVLVHLASAGAATELLLLSTILTETLSPDLLQILERRGTGEEAEFASKLTPEQRAAVRLHTDHTSADRRRFEGC